MTSDGGAKHTKKNDQKSRDQPGGDHESTGQVWTSFVRSQTTNIIGLDGTGLRNHGICPNFTDSFARDRYFNFLAGRAWDREQFYIISFDVNGVFLITKGLQKYPASRGIPRDFHNIVTAKSPRKSLNI